MLARWALMLCAVFGPKGAFGQADKGCNISQTTYPLQFFRRLMPGLINSADRCRIGRRLETVQYDLQQIGPHSVIHATFAVGL